MDSVFYPSAERVIYAPDTPGNNAGHGQTVCVIFQEWMISSFHIGYALDLRRHDMAEQQKGIFVSQLRVWLREISPAIWRRLLVRSDSTLADLHYTLQIAMGWTDIHLHQFLIHGKRYGIPKTGGVSFADDPRQVQLNRFRFREKERFLYEYDFRDVWHHEIRMEKLLPLDPKRTYPVCIGGAWSAPPEDCGGPWAYMALRQHYSPGWIAHRLAEILEQGNREECYEEMLSFQYWLNAKRLDRRTVNRQLERYANRDEA
jgi:hypothetical protein